MAKYFLKKIIRRLYDLQIMLQFTSTSKCNSNLYQFQIVFNNENSFKVHPTQMFFWPNNQL